jgi:hypothetical protein
MEPAAGTWEQKKDSVRRGLLFPYVGKSAGVFRCPSDTRRPTASRPVAFRTFSIVGGANGEDGSDYVKAKIYSDIKAPARKYVLVEEADTRGYNMGTRRCTTGKTSTSLIGISRPCTGSLSPSV